MWMTSTDDRGYVKYWQANLNNVHTFQAHNDPVRSSRWDKIISTAVLLLILVISNSCNIDDKLLQFRKNNKVCYKLSWCSFKMHTSISRGEI